MSTLDNLTQENPTEAHRVTGVIRSANSRHPDYPLLEGDLLVPGGPGVWTKVAPGLAVFGFRLTPEQEATLDRVEVVFNGLNYRVLAQPVPTTDGGAS